MGRKEFPAGFSVRREELASVSLGADANSGRFSCAEEIGTVVRARRTRMPTLRVQRIHRGVCGSTPNRCRQDPLSDWYSGTVFMDLESTFEQRSRPLASLTAHFGRAESRLLFFAPVFCES